MIDLRSQTLAIALEGDAGLCAALERALPASLVGARFTRVLLPSSVQRLQGTVERAAGGDRTVLTGELLPLLPMRANTPADQLLRVEVLSGVSEVSTRREWSVPEPELERYRRAWEAYRSALQGFEQRLRATASVYADEARRESQRYELAGGRYQDPDERDLRERVAAWNADVDALVRRVEAARSVPTPEQVRTSASRASSQSDQRPEVVLRAVLTDLRGGETWWVDEVRSTSADRAAALREALAQLLRDLSP